MRIAVYVRVSTSHQTQTQTIEQQLERLRAHIEAQSWQLADEYIFGPATYTRLHIRADVWCGQYTARQLKLTASAIFCSFYKLAFFKLGMAFSTAGSIYKVFTVS